MTEAEWLSCGDVSRMLNAVDPHEYDRRLRLFACGCCRRIWNLLDTEASRLLVELSEQYADGLATYHDLQKANVLHRTSPSKHCRATDAAIDAAAAFEASYRSSAMCFQRCANSAAEAVALATCEDGQSFTKWIAEHKEKWHQRSVLTDIIPNPFRPVALDPSWRTEAVVALAEGIYAERAFERMPVLADALEDAGCSHDGILRHCRGDGPHVKGCWVVDLLTGRT